MSEWSPQQDDALVAVDRWLSDPGGRQVFRLFGYAGTGKTTLARHLASNVQGQVYFGAYTGKAAHVLRQKGCPGASTIHSLIYNTREKSRALIKALEAELAELRGRGQASSDRANWLEEEIKRERENLSQPAFKLNKDSVIKDADLVVIDECSMVDDRMGEDLLSFGTPVLVLGDPAQLPPVMGGGFFTEQKPDVMLTEIHRQARGNPIIDMATTIREGGTLALGEYGDSRVVRQSQINAEMVLAADQVLVGRNKTRYAYNDRIRTLKNLNPEHPVSGDKLVCLRNNHDRGLLNGAIWHVDGVGEVADDLIVADLISYDDDQHLEDVEMHSHYFQGRAEKLAWYERKSADEFDYGYAMTTHKAQGSQWADVMLFDESSCFRTDARRWLYTGVTRAAEKITIVR